MRRKGREGDNEGGAGSFGWVLLGLWTMKVGKVAKLTVAAMLMLASNVDGGPPGDGDVKELEKMKEGCKQDAIRLMKQSWCAKEYKRIYSDYIGPLTCPDAGDSKFAIVLMKAFNRNLLSGNKQVLARTTNDGEYSLVSVRDMWNTRGKVEWRVNPDKGVGKWIFRYMTEYDLGWLKEEVNQA